VTLKYDNCCAPRAQENLAKEKLNGIGAKRLRGVKYQSLTHIGDPATAIVRAEKALRLTSW
jgi:hypothetical protein